MDQLDHRILDELQSRGLKAKESLPASLGVSYRTVCNRINSMHKKGLIRIVAIPNPVLLGYKAWSKIGIKVKPDYLASVASKLIAHPGVYYAAFTYGGFDLMFNVRCQTFEGLAYFLNKELPDIKGIISYETIILVQPRKYYNFSWPEPEYRRIKTSKYEFNIIGDGQKIDIDENDYRIISILQDDALTHPSKIKSVIGLGESTIRRRIKSLQDNQVYGIQVIPSTELQHQLTCAICIVINKPSGHKVVDNIINEPPVYVLAGALGRFNYLVNARFHSTEELYDFVTEKISRFDGVSSVETYINVKPIKNYNIINWS